MGNCLRKPMRDQDESGLIANAAKATPSLGFANDDDAVDLPVRSRVKEGAMSSLANKGRRGRYDDDDDNYDDDDDGYGGRNNRSGRRGGRYSDDEDEDDRRGGGNRRGGQGGRRNRYGDDEDEDEEDDRGRGRRTNRNDDNSNDRKRSSSRGRNGRDEAEDNFDTRSGRNGGGQVQRNGSHKNLSQQQQQQVQRNGSAKNLPQGNNRNGKNSNYDDDDKADTRSIRSTHSTKSNKSGKSGKDDDFASLKSKGQSQAGNSRQQAVANFAAEARSLRNQQLSSGKSQHNYNSGDDDDDDDGPFRDSASTFTAGGTSKRPKLTQFGAMKKRVCSIKLTVEYSVRRGMLSIHIQDVEGLSERKHGKPDTYIKFYISPDPKRKTKKKTNVCKANSLPNFDEKFEFKIAPNEIGTKSIKMGLWLCGGITNSVLGEVGIGLSNYAQRGDFSFSEYFGISSKSKPAVDPTNNPMGAISGPEDNDSDDDAKSVRSVRSTWSTESGRNPFGESDDDDSRSVMSSMSVTSTAPKPTERAINKKKLCNIRLSVGYNQAAGVLRVHVQELGELPWTEETKPDLYVKMFVAPDPKKETKRKTRVVNNNVAPTFDELFEWKVPDSEIKSKALIVSLCEEGTISNDILGEVSIGFINFEGDFEWEDWFAINKKRSGQGRLSLTKRTVAKKDIHEYQPDDPNSDARSIKEEVVKPVITDKGANKTAIAQLKLDISYEAARGTFQIHIHKLKGLMNYANMDVFVKVSIAPDQAKTEKKTKSVNFGGKPLDFDEIIEYRYAIGEVQRKSLVLQLYQDMSMGQVNSKNKPILLAQVTIGFSSTQGANFSWSDWYSLFQPKK